MKRMLKEISGLIMLVLVAMIAVSGTDVLTVNAANDEASEFLGTFDGYMYTDTNTLGATVSVKSIYLKVKKDDAAQNSKPTKVTVNGKP